MSVGLKRDRLRRKTAANHGLRPAHPPTRSRRLERAEGGASGELVEGFAEAIQIFAAAAAG